MSRGIKPPRMAIEAACRLIDIQRHPELIPRIASRRNVTEKVDVVWRMELSHERSAQSSAYFLIQSTEPFPCPGLKSQGRRAQASFADVPDQR
jgi:hypothetical protein